MCECVRFADEGYGESMYLCEACLCEFEEFRRQKKAFEKELAFQRKSLEDFKAKGIPIDEWFVNSMIDAFEILLTSFEPEELSEEEVDDIFGTNR